SSSRAPSADDSSCPPEAIPRASAKFPRLAPGNNDAAVEVPGGRSRGGLHGCEDEREFIQLLGGPLPGGCAAGAQRGSARASAEVRAAPRVRGSIAAAPSPAPVLAAVSTFWTDGPRRRSCIATASTC